MDYSYFNSAPQPYQYFGIPTTSGPGQPMSIHSFGNAPQQQSTEFTSTFATFPDTFQYDHLAFIPQANVQSQIPSRAPSRPLTNPQSISPGLVSFDNLPISTPTELPQPDDGFPHRSSSEERENMTPQQSKRKAQNRAAQRAFRERKEQHLKSLEAKLNNLQQQSMSLDSENERLRKELARMATENELLRATSHAQPSLGEDDENFDPLGYTSPNFVSSKERTAKKAQMFGGIHTIIIDDLSGDVLLNSSQTWDYIQAHELFRDGLVDVGDVIERLKKSARCDGQGPVFREGEIRQAITESAVAGGRDELL